jgi:hypothetical protein
MLAGLSRCGIRKIPPDFCASPGLVISNTATAAKLHRFRRMSVPPHTQREPNL